MVACTDALGPDSSIPSLEFSFAGPAAASAAPDAVFRKANGVRIRVVEESGERRELADVTRSYTPNEARTVRVNFSTTESRIDIQLEILYFDHPLFVGSTTIEPSADRATIAVEAVPAKLSVAAEEEFVVTSLHHPVRVPSAVLYATGDTLSEEGFGWISLTPDVVQFDDDGLIRGIDNGEGFVEVSAMGLTETIAVRVRQSVGSLGLSDDEKTFTEIGGTESLTATPVDAGGTPIAGVTVAWASSDSSVVTVDEVGVITSTGNGRAKVIASVDSTAESVSVVVAEDSMLVVDVLEELDEATAALALAVAMLSDEMIVTSRDPRRQRHGLGWIDPDDSRPYWDEVHEARVAAENAWGLLADADPDVLTGRYGAIIRYVEGMAHKALAENFCVVSYDGGPPRAGRRRSLDRSPPSRKSSRSGRPPEPTNGSWRRTAESPRRGSRRVTWHSPSHLPTRWRPTSRRGPRSTRSRCPTRSGPRRGIVRRWVCGARLPIATDARVAPTRVFPKQSAAAGTTAPRHRIPTWE